MSGSRSHSRQNLRQGSRHSSRNNSSSSLRKALIELDPADFNNTSTTIGNLLRNNPEVSHFEVGKEYASSRSVLVKLTRPIFIIEINPADVKNENEKAILNEIINEKKHKDTFLVQKDELKCQYIEKEDDSHSDRLNIYKLSNNFLVRRVKKDSMTPDAVRYEIIANNEFAQGSSKVFHSLATLRPDFSRNLHKKRVVKIIDMAQMISLYREYKWGYAEVKKEIEKEYELTLHAKHIHIKPPVFDSFYAFLVLKLLPGKLLEVIIDKNIERTSRLSVMKCLHYGLAISQSLQTQVYDNGLIHRDIKPGNILLSDKDNQISANIFDFGLSKLIENKEKRICGSPLYMAPETALRGISKKKSDVYSFGRILAELLGFNSRQIKTLEDLNEEYKNGMRFDGMFDNDIFKELSDVNREKISIFLKKASHRKLKERYTPLKTTEELKIIIHDIKQEYIQKFLDHAKNVEHDLTYQQRHRYSTFKRDNQQLLEQKHEINASKKLADIVRENTYIPFNEGEWEAADKSLSGLINQCESLGLLPESFFMAKNEHNILKIEDKNCKSSLIKI